MIEKPLCTVIAAVALASLAGCADLIGFPDYENGSSSGAGGSAGSGGSGGAGSGGSGGAGGSAGSGGSGGGPVCEMGTTQACHVALDPAMAGIGQCKAGTQTCGADGFGPCEGEVAALVEECDTPAQDENCDGIATCTGQFRWAKLFGDANGNVITDASNMRVAAASDGGIVIAATVRGTLDLGGGPLEGGLMDNDVLVAKLDAEGRHVWARRFGDNGFQTLRGLAVDGEGGIIVAGDFSGTLDFGGGELQPVGTLDMFVTKLDPQGAHSWSKRFGSAAVDSAMAAAVDAAGDVLVTGFTEGPIDFGGGLLTGADRDVIVARLKGTDGGYIWAKRYGGTGSEFGADVAVDAAGDLAVVGSYDGTLNFGGQPAAPPSAGMLDAFVAKLKGADGTSLWSRGYGNANAQQAMHATFAPDGGVVVSGSMVGAFKFGNGLIGNGASTTGDVFVLKLSAAGADVFPKVLGDSSKAQLPRGLAVDRAGNIVLGAINTGTISFDAVNLQSDGSEDFALIKLDPSGKGVWGIGPSATLFQSPLAVAADPLGNVLVVGDVEAPTPFDLGGGPLVSAGGYDLLVAKFAP